jgi:hypothetical protein
MITVWYDPDDRKLKHCVNNGTVTAGAALATGPRHTAGTVWFGVNNVGDNALTGQMDELVVHDRVLTSDERAELYNAGRGKFYGDGDFGG